MKLFGKKQEITRLTNTIKRLEREKHILEQKIEKALERERRATAAKQQAESELKKLKQQLHTIQQQQEKTHPQPTPQTTPPTTPQQTASISKLREILDELDTIHTKKPQLTTLHLPPNTQPPDNTPPQLKQALNKINSQTGYAIYHDENHIIHLILIPPLLLTHHTHQQNTHFNTKPLRELINTPDPILILNTHAGETQAILATTSEIITHTTIKTSVKSKHTKGGWSQRRFERLREEDIKHHADKTRDAIQPLLQQQPTHIITTGDPHIAKQIINNPNTIHKTIHTPRPPTPEKTHKETLTTNIYTY